MKKSEAKDRVQMGATISVNGRRATVNKSGAVSAAIKYEWFEEFLAKGIIALARTTDEGLAIYTAKK